MNDAMSAATGVAAPELADRNPTRVLVVEDDADCAATIRLMLETRTGDGRGTSHEARCINGEWAVMAVHTLAGAAEVLHANTFDLALVDLDLPDGPHGEIVSLVHNLAPELPIVIQSGNSDWDVIRKYVRRDGSGMVMDYIIKGDPISPCGLKHRLCHAKNDFHVFREQDILTHKGLIAPGGVAASQ